MDKEIVILSEGEINTLPIPADGRVNDSNNKNNSNDNIKNNNNGSNINNFVQPVNCVSESYKSFSAGSQSVNILLQLKPICQW